MTLGNHAFLKDTKSPPMLKWRGIRVLGGIDVEVLLGVSARISSSISYLLTAFFSTIYLNPAEQGVFFTFLSFVAMTVFVELGLGTVVIQFTAHEMALIESPDVSQRARARSRLNSIGRFAFAWFWTGALGLFFVLAVGGFFFFAGEPGAESALPGPWLLLVVFVTIELIFFPFWALLEGARRIMTVYGYRFAKAIALGLGTWGSMMLGAGLWSAPLGYAAVLPFSVAVLIGHFRYFRQFASPTDGETVRWGKEILPLHWRIATSWLAGYLSVWAITPIALKLFGAEVAGQVGMTWTISSGISAVASALIMVKFSRFGYLVVSRSFRELDQIILVQGSLSVAASIVAAFLVISLDWYALHHGIALAHRLLPPESVAVFMIGMVAQQITVPMSTYLRAFKREPFLGISVISSILLLIAVVILGELYGPPAIAFGYASVMCGVVVAGVIVFVRCRSAWTKS